MSEFCVGLLGALVRSGLVLTFSAALVLFLRRVFPIASPRLRRVLCFAVVVQGCLLIRISLTIPGIPGIPGISASAAPPAAGQLDSPAADDALSLMSAMARSLLTSDHANHPPMKAGVTWMSRFPWAVSLVAVWAIGIVILLFRSVWNYVRFIQRIPAGNEVPADWGDECERLRRQAGLRHAVTLRPTTNLGPLLCWHPRGYQLLVPFDIWRLLEPQQRIMILRHELAHLQRGDLWKSLVLRLLALPHWFNPLAWWMVNQFDDDAECACDDAVRQAGPTQTIDYARTLLLLGGSPRATFLTSPAASGHGLADRIRRLIVPHPRKDSNMKKMALVTLVIGISTLHLLRFQSQAEDQPVPPPAADVQGQGIRLNATTDGNLLFVTLANEVPQSGSSKRTEAVVDLGSLLKDLTEFQQAREKLVPYYLRLEQTGQKALTELVQLNQELKSASPDAIEAKRQQVQEKTEAFHALRKILQNMRERKESEMFLGLYQKITAEVALYAKEQGIRVVRKVERSSPRVETSLLMNSSSGTLTFMAAPTTDVQVPSTSVGDATLLPNTKVILTDFGGGTSENLAVPTPSSGIYLSQANLNIAAVANPSRLETMDSVVTNSETGVAVTLAKAPNVRNVTVFVDHDQRSIINRSQPSEVLKWLNQKEVLYVEPGDDFDITPEILKRMNTKFDQKQTGTSSSEQTGTSSK